MRRKAAGGEIGSEGGGDQGVPTPGMGDSLEWRLGGGEGRRVDRWSEPVGGSWLGCLGVGLFRTQVSGGIF